MSVTVIASLYGDRFDKFVPAWLAALDALEQQPAEVIVATDHERDIPGVRTVVSECRWSYPQAWYQNKAARQVDTEWLWIVDIDNLALPDALNGIHQVSSDVWQMGYVRSDDGVYYVVPQLSCTEFLSLSGNPFTAGSAVRTEAFVQAGGHRDIAFEDWGLWRQLALAGFTFESSGRAHYRYVRHPEARSETEMGPWNRDEHLAEMLEGERVHA